MTKGITQKGLQMKDKSNKTLPERIGLTKREMLKLKPRSERRIELEARLKNLMVKQLRFENRIERQHAA